MTDDRYRRGVVPLDWLCVVQFDIDDQRWCIPLWVQADCPGDAMEKARLLQLVENARLREIMVIKGNQVTRFSS